MLTHEKEVIHIGPINSECKQTNKKTTIREGVEEINIPISISSYLPVSDSASQLPNSAESLSDPVYRGT